MPAIQALNSGVTLPANPIHVVFRSDASGTTGQNGLGGNRYIPVPVAFKSRLSTAVNAIG